MRAFKRKSGGCSAAPASSAQGFIQFDVPQPPMIGIVASRMATNVTRNKGGRKTLGALTPAASAALADACAASQRGDSGTKKNAKIPKIKGAAPTSGAQRQSSGVMATWAASEFIRKSPILAAVPMTPASAGRDMLDHASETNATPLGHIPPTPVQAK